MDFFERFQQFTDKLDHGFASFNKKDMSRADYWAFIRKTYFLSVEEYTNFRSEYTRRLPQFVRFAPSPAFDGYYKILFLGKVRSQKDNRIIYLPTSTYFLYQLRCTKHFSFGAIGAAEFEFSVIGVIVYILMTIALFVTGIVFRFAIGILLTILQFILSRFESNEESF